MNDLRSPLASKIMNANPRAYESLVVESGTPDLARELLKDVRPEQLLDAPPKSPAAANAMLAGLWLWHDGLNECHAIVQKSPKDFGDSQHPREMTATFSFWHAIMHRREGDFSNSKYWYARCENHPILPSLASLANDVINPFPADKAALRIVAGGWNADALVDLVESVHGKPTDPRYALAVALQKLEWRVLFDDCTRRAK